MGLDCWDFDPAIRDALLQHHDELVAEHPPSLGTLVLAADCFAAAAGFGGLTPPSAWPATVLHRWGYETAEAQEQLTEQICVAVTAEKELLA